MTRHTALRQEMTGTAPAHAVFNQGLGFFYVMHGHLLVVGTAIQVSKHCQNINCLDEQSFIPN